MITNSEKWALLRQTGDRIYGQDGRYHEQLKALNDGRLDAALAELLVAKANRNERRRQKRTPLAPHIHELIESGQARIFEVELGRYRSGPEYLKALEAAGHRVGEWERFLLLDSGFRCSKTLYRLQLVLLAAGGLWPSGKCPKRPTWEQSYRKAANVGLKRAPAEVGPAWRLSYTDQPVGVRVNVGMTPLTDSAGSAGVYSLVCIRGVSWLLSSDAVPGVRWYPRNQLVFRLP